MEESSATVCLIIYWNYSPLSLHPRSCIEYTTWQWDFWKISKRKIGERKLWENWISMNFQKGKLEGKQDWKWDVGSYFRKKNWRAKFWENGMLGHLQKKPTKRFLRKSFVALLLRLSQRLSWPCWCTAGGFAGDEQPSPAAGFLPANPLHFLLLSFTFSPLQNNLI